MIINTEINPMVSEKDTVGIMGGEDFGNEDKFGSYDGEMDEGSEDPLEKLGGDEELDSEEDY